MKPSSYCPIMVQTSSSNPTTTILSLLIIETSRLALLWSNGPSAQPKSSAADKVDEAARQAKKTSSITVSYQSQPRRQLVQFREGIASSDHQPAGRKHPLRGAAPWPQRGSKRRLTTCGRQHQHPQHRDKPRAPSQQPEGLEHRADLNCRDSQSTLSCRAPNTNRAVCGHQSWGDGFTRDSRMV